MLKKSFTTLSGSTRKNISKPPPKIAPQKDIAMNFVFANQPPLTYASLIDITRSYLKSKKTFEII